MLAVSEIVKDLVFPLVLLLVGGGLTSVVYPRITAARARDQKGREIRTALVTDMSQEVTTMLMTVQFVRMGSATVSQADLDRAYQHWEIAKSVIATKLLAYFPHGDLGPRWLAYAHEVTQYYASLENPDSGWHETRERLLRECSALTRRVLSEQRMQL